GERSPRADAMRAVRLGHLVDCLSARLTLLAASNLLPGCRSEAVSFRWIHRASWPEIRLLLFGTHPHGHVRTPLQTHTWRKQNANPLTNRFRSTGWSVERYCIVRRIFACKVPTIGSQIGSSRSFSSVCFASWT